MLPSILWLRASPSYYAFEAIILLFHRSWSEVNRLNLSLPRNTLVALIHKSWMQISWNNDRLRNFRWSLLLFYWFLYVSSNFSKMNRDFIFFLQLILIWFSILLSAWWSCCHLGVISNDLLNRLSCTYILIDIFAIYSCKTNNLYIFPWWHKVIKFWASGFFLCKYFRPYNWWVCSSRFCHTLFRSLNTRLFCRTLLGASLSGRNGHMNFLSSIQTEVTVSTSCNLALRYNQNWTFHDLRFWQFSNDLIDFLLQLLPV